MKLAAGIFPGSTLSMSMPVNMYCHDGTVSNLTSLLPQGQKGIPAQPHHVCVMLMRFQPKQIDDVM